MWQGSLVVDGVAHAYAFEAENRVEACPPEAYDGLVGFLYSLGHVPLESTEPGYQLSLEEFSAGWSAEELASVYFEESDVDVLAYHGVEIAGFFKRGSSPYLIGVELKQAYPDRVLLYAPVDPFDDPSRQLDLMDQRAESDDVDGFKFYPSNGVLDPAARSVKTVAFDDPEVAFPFFERARQLGIPHIAIHKAVPVGPGPLGPNNVDDVSSAAVEFMDLTFEIVHSGWAFLEECALQMMVHPNIYANLELSANYVVRQPRRFAEILGSLMTLAGSDRLLFGTGAALAHPQPILEHFAAFQQPDDLIDGMGYPPLTDEDKRKILGENMLRLHGREVEKLTRQLAEDDIAKQRATDGGAPSSGPWHQHRARLAAR